ncbi:MAG TPA: hypothetical protein VKG25_19705, partial [Bryobacteraceae bacterium]|nr:hypothetical protein [Bryobacteraceae bacterium]
MYAVLQSGALRLFDQIPNDYVRPCAIRILRNVSENATDPIVTAPGSSIRMTQRTGFHHPVLEDGRV